MVHRSRLKPRQLAYQVVINNWPPAEGQAYVDGTRAFCESHGWPVARTVIRRYRVHTNATRVVTQYHNNRVELQAREDLVLDHFPCQGHGASPKPRS